MTMLTAEAVTKLQDTLDYITAHPEVHNQATWIQKDVPGATCGTSGCVAGWLTLRNDAIPEDAFTPVYGYDRQTGRMDYDTPKWFEVSYDRFPVQDRANQVLGVSYPENQTEAASEARELLDIMFEGDRDLPEIWAIAQILAEGRLNIPDSVDTDGITVDDGYLYNPNRENDHTHCGCCG